MLVQKGGAKLKKRLTIVKQAHGCADLWLSLTRYFPRLWQSEQVAYTIRNPWLVPRSKSPRANFRISYRMQRKHLYTPILSLAFALVSMTAHADSAKASSKGVSGLSADFVYKYLVGEIAGQRGDLGLA